MRASFSGSLKKCLLERIDSFTTMHCVQNSGYLIQADKGSADFDRVVRKLGCVRIKTVCTSQENVELGYCVAVVRFLIYTFRRVP